MQKTILIGHGSGGTMTSDLIRDVFARHLNNPILSVLGDSAILQIGNKNLAFTTDSFVIDPVFFPGGNIGKLAVCGTVNDLAVSGSKPLFLSAGFILEEGFPLGDLETIVKSMAEEAAFAGVQVVTGDTKVVSKGQCDKIFINTAGIGIIDDKHAEMSKGTFIQPGDKIIVNGFLGDHEMAILAARQNLTFEPPVISDVCSLNAITQHLLNELKGVHFMRDLTRGGLVTVLAEVVAPGNFGIEIDETAIPVRDQVTGMCEIFGFNPLYLANEGKFMLVVSPDEAGKALEIMKSNPFGNNAAIIGEIRTSNPGKVLMNSVIGGTRIVDKLAGEQLPRIC